MKSNIDFDLKFSTGTVIFVLKNNFQLCDLLIAFELNNPFPFGESIVVFFGHPMLLIF